MARGPVPYTCPDIDKIIAMLEDLRKSNDSLRSWGEEQEDRADDLQSQVETLERKIEELEDQLNAKES